MAERAENITSSIQKHLSAELPDYASISISLGLFEIIHTAKQPSEPSLPEQVRVALWLRLQLH